METGKVVKLQHQKGLAKYRSQCCPMAKAYLICFNRLLLGHFCHEAKDFCLLAFKQAFCLTVFRQGAQDVKYDNVEESPLG